MSSRAGKVLRLLVRAVVGAGERGWQLVGNHVFPRVLRSRTGHANPRVRHLVHRPGFAWHSYRSTKPNMAAWLRDRRPIFPHVVQVQTINRCNAGCEFCPYPETVALQPMRIMDDELWTRIINECAAEPSMVTLVPMSKNEPTMDTRLASRIAEFAKIRQPHQIIEVVTNGSTLTPGRMAALVDAGLDLLTVSVNAANEETYNRVMKKLSWQRVTAHLDALASADLPTLNVYVRFVKDLTNRDEVRAFRRRWRRLNLFGFDVNNRAGAVEGFEQLRVRYSPALEWLRRETLQAIYPVCPYLFGLAHVLENGDVPMCANDWKFGEVIGNVHDSSLREIFNSPRMNQLRELQAAGHYEEIEACRNCSFYQEFWRRNPE